MMTAIVLHKNAWSCPQIHVKHAVFNTLNKSVINVLMAQMKTGACLHVCLFVSRN